MTKEIEDLDLGRFKYCINKDNLFLNDDGTFNYWGDLELSKMNLNSLLEIPIKFRNVSGHFYCSQNNLVSLEGCPQNVYRSFNCWDNQLISLQYAPKEVGEYFYCNGNNLLSYAHTSKIYSRVDFDPNHLKISDKAIDTIKRMTFDQRINELKFFEKHDIKAYEMMIKILEENDLGYGPKAKEMVELTESYDIGNLI